MNRPHRRRQFLIQRAFQGRFIAWMLVVIVLFGLCFGGVLYLILDSALESSLQSAHLQVESLWQRLGMAVLLGNVIAILVAGMAAAIVVLVYSHRIAGPLYRIGKILESLGRGELDMPLQLREGDQLQELVAVLRQTVERLRRRRQRRLALIAAIEEKIAERPELQEIIGELRKLEEGRE